MNNERQCKAKSATEGERRGQTRASETRTRQKKKQSKSARKAVGKGTKRRKKIQLFSLLAAKSKARWGEGESEERRPPV